MKETKKLALLRIYQILRKYSDSDHPLKQDEIASILEKDYGIVLERKAIGRNISLLKEAGYEIASDKRKGSYLQEREFEESELRLLIDAVLSSGYIPENQSKELAEKLQGLSNKYFRSRVKNIYSVKEWNKTDNQEVFLNLDIIDQAIERKKQIRFDYYKYGIDMKMHKTSTIIATPYQLIVKNQRYYLLGCYEKNEKKKTTSFYQINHMRNIEVLENSIATDIKKQNIEAFKNGINYNAISVSWPYMFADEPIRVKLLVDEIVIDQVIDWFGKDIQITKADIGRIWVGLKVSRIGIKKWAMQYVQHVEIVDPPDLRDEMREVFEKASVAYGR